VDENIANRIKNSQINDIRNQKLQVVGRNVGIFAGSIIESGSKSWKSLEGDAVQWYDKTKVKVNNVAKIAYEATGNAMGYVENKATKAWNASSNLFSSAKKVAVDTYNYIDNDIKNSDDNYDMLNKNLGIDNELVRKSEGILNGFGKFL
jgi:hypothetical protein